MLSRRTAIVLGGAACWRDDLHQALSLLPNAPEVFAVNDQIVNFSSEFVAYTLHPEKLDGWLDQRAESKLPPPRECWVRKSGDSCWPDLHEWGGSSGLFAFQVAREHGHERIIFCGVPMDDSPNAFHRKAGAVNIYTRHQWVWRRHLKEIRLFARSMSGWTAEKLGQPDENWINSN